MNIQYIEPEPHVDFKLDGTVLTIGDIKIDLAKEQQNSEKIIDITRDGNNLVLGVGGKDGYVANIIIPPKEYKIVDTGKKDDEGNEIYEPVAIPLDTDKVTLKLWQFKKENTNTEDMEVA